MNLNQIREHRTEIELVAGSYGARNLRVFGSVARGESDPPLLFRRSQFGVGHRRSSSPDLLAEVNAIRAKLEATPQNTSQDDPDHPDQKST